MKSVVRQKFEEWHGFEVCDDMDIQTEVAWGNWKIAWNAAMEHAEATANKQAKNYAYTPAQKRALKTWLQIAAKSDDDSLACAAGFAASTKPYNARHKPRGEATSA
jgi:hypothetical protein